MKKIILLFAITIGALMLNAQNGAYMEYRISTTTGFNGSVKVKYSEFGSGTEFNMVIPQMPGGGFSNKSLMQKDKPGIVFMIDDKNKTYSENTQTENGANDNKNYTVKKLGEETVSGYKCVHAMITEGAETYEIWSTKDIPDFNKYSQAINTNANVGSVKREKALKDAGCDGVPVKTVHASPSQGTMTMELVKIEKRTYKKTDFDLPAGYSKTGNSATDKGVTGTQMKTPQELQNMTPEERTKYVEEMKKKYGK